MKCPYCEYEHGWSGEQCKDVKGESGNFYELSNDVRAERDTSYYHHHKEKATVYGCPKCKKVFID